MPTSFCTFCNYLPVYAFVGQYSEAKSNIFKSFFFFPIYCSSGKYEGHPQTLKVQHEFLTVA